MTTDRARIQALTTLVQSATTGAYTLPADVVEAHQVWQRLRQIEIPPPQQFSIEDAVDRIVAAATVGEPFDPVELVRGYSKSEDDRRLHGEAQKVMREALDQVASIAVLTAGDATERIITEHLRPAHDELMEKARESAVLLRPYMDAEYRLDLQGIVAATSAKVRAAYLGLTELVDRRRLIVQARTKANVIGGRRAEHDQANLFATFERPMVFFPTWKPQQRVPQLPVPEEETARLLWLTSEQATGARPWLPTIAEQDRAWWAQFGEQVMQGRANQHNARAMAAQAVGIESRDGTATPIPAPPTPTERRTAFAGRMFGTTAGVPVNGGPVEKE